MTNSPTLDAWKPLAGFLGAALGEDAEVVLHDLTGEAPRIVAIAHPVAAHRTAGVDSADEVSSLVEAMNDDVLMHVDRRDASGSVRRTHALVLRDDTGAPTLLLSVHIDQRRMLQARDLLSSLTRSDTTNFALAPQTTKSALDTSTRSLAEQRLREARFDVHSMSADDKVSFVAQLHEESFFRIKGAVADLAAILHVSEATIYRYVSQAKRRGDLAQPRSTSTARDGDDDLQVSQKLSDDLRLLLPLLRFVAEIFGSDTEVVLHDLRDLNSTVVALAHSHLSGRRLGDSATDFTLTILGTVALKSRDYLAEYESRARNGALFRSHAFFFRDDRGEIFSMLTINTELRRLVQARELFERLTRILPVEGARTSERLNITPKEMTIEAIDTEISTLGIHPSAMTPLDKSRIVQRLYERGIFLMRGSVPRAARALQLSEPSIYRHLTAVRNESKSQREANGRG